MKTFLLICGVSALFFFACEARNANPELFIPTETAVASELSSGVSSNPPSEIRPVLNLTPEQRLLGVQNLNLDEDEALEQVLIVGNRTDLSVPLTLLVADFNAQLNTFFLAWSTPTQAVGTQNFELSLEDVIGDGSQVLVFQGQTRLGEQVLELYRRLRTPGGHLAFGSILNLNARGLIRLERPARADQYTEDLAIAAFEVVVEEPSEQAGSSPQLKRSVWDWRFQAGRYQLARVETLQLAAADSNFVARISNLDSAAFLQLLAGPWLKTESRQNQFVFIDPLEQNLTFFNGETQEVYTWTQALRTLRNGLYLAVQNSQVPNLRLNLNLNLQADDQLSLLIQGATNFTGGEFRRLADSTQQALLRQRDARNYFREGPRGLYKNSRGLEINFELPLFNLVQNNQRQTGSASYFEWNGQHYLQLQPISESGQAAATRTYLAEQRLETRDRQILRTLRLIPGTLESHGFRPHPEDALVLEQLEVLSANPVGSP